ncbi:hypothetical protein HDU97_009820 [Phlyctochytrium planicorne]|nr:hypothetical protein HDU97_009820 [Phlyctochytrium planicorne]
MAAIMRDPELMQSVSTLAHLLQKEKLIDPMNPGKPPSKWDMIRMFSNKDIRTQMTKVAEKLKEAGVLDQDLLGAAAAGSSAQANQGSPSSPAEFLFSLFSGPGADAGKETSSPNNGQTLEIPEEVKKKLGKR